MLNLITYNFSSQAVYRIIFFGILLFGFFRLFKLFFPYLCRRRNVRRFFKRYLPVVEFFSWLLFFVYAIQFLLHHNTLFALGLFVFAFILVFWSAQLVLKDVIAGIILKSSGKFSISETLRSAGHSGEIVRFRYRTVELETEQGKTLFVPYRFILSQINEKSHPAEKMSSHTFNLEIPAKGDLSESLDAIRRAILNLPWSSIKKVPQIKVAGETRHSFLLETTVYALEKEFFYKIEKYVKENFGLKPEK